VLLDIKKFCDKIDNKNIEKIDISYHPSNLGCSPSWNYHFKQYPYAEFFIKADDDDEFSPNDLRDMVDEIEKGCGIVFFDNGPTKYTCFGITRETLKIVGLFDENLWPANFEDDDYNIRLKLANIKEVIIARSIKHVGSGSSRNLNDHRIEHQKLVEFIKTTQEYFNKKWGDRYPNNYQYPFNDKNNKITNIDYNFDYRMNKIFRCDYTK
jgi:GT2 family glycosyltransferase